jgi:hypothetical protein
MQYNKNEGIKKGVLAGTPLYEIFFCYLRVFTCLITDDLRFAAFLE